MKQYKRIYIGIFTVERVQSEEITRIRRYIYVDPPVNFVDPPVN